MSARRAPWGIAGIALLGASAIAGALSASAEGALPLPGPAPRFRDAPAEALRTNDTCIACHADIGAEWKASMHSIAYEDPVFKKAFAIEPLGFCRNCHAPEGDPAATLDAAAASVGVGCVTCHVQDEHIVGAKASPARDGAHETLGDARLATEAACAGCHEFDFPGQPGRFMQGTVSEHASSRHADRTCADCHMKRVGAGARGKGHVDHTFRVAGDARMIRSAVKISARRPTPDVVEVTLTADEVGHDFPTGDMFRRLELRAVANGPDGEIKAIPAFARREFMSAPAGATSQRVQTRDTRVSGDGSPTTAEIRFADDVSGMRVHWVVAYQRMDRGLAKLFDVDMDADEIIVAEGDL